jgi:hypothetical protein
MRIDYGIIQIPSVSLKEDSKQSCAEGWLLEPEILSPTIIRNLILPTTGQFGSKI